MLMDYGQNLHDLETSLSLFRDIISTFIFWIHKSLSYLNYFYILKILIRKKYDQFPNTQDDRNYICYIMGFIASIILISNIFLIFLILQKKIQK